MKEGRPFSKDFGTDTTKIIFNEAELNLWVLPIQLVKTVKLWGEEREIIGVTEDFHFESFHEVVKPVFFY